jgi:hypothetical protein
MGPPTKLEVYKDAKARRVTVFGALSAAVLWGTIANELKLHWGKIMDGWRKALVLGSIGAAGILFMKKKYPAGVLATGVGLALLAAEYPERFEKVRLALPDYFERGMRVMEMAGQAGKRITEAAGRSAVESWEEFGG